MALRFPSNTFQAAVGPVLREGSDRREEAPAPWLTRERQDSRLDSCACAMCHGGEGDPGPSPYPCPPLLPKAGASYWSRNSRMGPGSCVTLS